MIEFGKDLVEKILSILPPKILMRFRCASKEWYALINNPWFVAQHLFNFNSNSKHNNNLSTNCVLLMKKLLVSKDTNNITNETEEEEEERVFSLLNFCNDNDDEHNTILSSVEDIKITLSMSLKTRGESLGIIGHCNGIICLLLVDSFQVILWNPAIQEFKLLPPLPFLPDDLWCKHAQGFGFDPKLNQYKVVSIGLASPFSNFDDGYNYYHPPKAAIFTLSSSDSWREINTNSLETETTVLRPEEFQIQFKQMCYWFGHEQHKELSWFDATEEERIRQVIILFDIGDEVFQDIMLPESLCQPCVSINGNLLVWNESLALLGWAMWMPVDIVDASFGIWVMDDHELGSPTGPWTKHITFEPTEKPLAFLNGDEILMYDLNECIFSYNLGTKRREDLHIEITPSNDIITTVVYEKSIVSILGDNKLESRDNSTINFSLLEYFPSDSLTVNKEYNSYSLWAIPPDDVSQRIKNVMKGLRAEFGGPEIEPHIPVVGSIRMFHEDVLDRLRSFHSCNQCNVCTYQAKVDSVVIRNFYHQCVSLLIDSSTEVSKHLRYITGIFGEHFGFYKDVRPHLSLLYGNLTEEERKIALEKVNILDESISSLSFTITQFAVYKIDYKDTTLKSWKKIAEYTLPSHLMLKNENA